MKLLRLFDSVRFYLSVILVALAVALLTVAQKVDEEPVIYWLKAVIGELAKGLEEPEATAPNVWVVHQEGRPVRVVGKGGEK